MVTDARRQVDAERVASMRVLLAQPGGRAEIARRYGESATESPEFAAAERQNAAVAARAREARESAIREQQQRADRAQADRAHGASTDRPDREELQERLDKANQHIDATREEVQSQVRDRGHARMQSM
ncbi:MULTISPECIES: hypothetical protein [Gordonia]|uniref:hypothetical protein n=1 Tax=Gordonia TaxID=2053 RepID=UPI00257A477C|nr:MULTISPECIES: hypothetical protein [Gordonia]